MATELVDADLSKGLEQVAAGLDEVLAAGVEPSDSPEAIGLIRELESLGRRLDAARVDLVDAIDRKGLHRVDGHHSAKVMVRHVAKLSGPEAAARARTASALRDLPRTKQAFRAGQVGTCQVRRLARVHANPRVRDRLHRSEERLLGFATGEDYKFFDTVMTDWVRLADEDGTCDTNQRNHENRDARLTQHYDQSWEFLAGCGSLSGAELKTIWDHFVNAEFLADWDKASIEHGDATTKAHLERTDGQRRFDALFAIFQKAAAAEPGGKTPELVTNLVIDDATYERILVFLATGVRPEADPDDETFRCSTIDGHPVEPTEAVAASLLGKLRRVVIGADSVVIDLGRAQRLFTGSARLAAQLGNTECFWPGCHVPVSQCQIDHLRPFTERNDRGGGGRTNPDNGGPACGKHNRHKEHGYTVRRDPTGHWHTTRPDGTEIE
jgi:hypothetical protein